MTNAEDSAPLRLSREDLYELTWSKPMSELAEDFGISDVALAKRCRRLGIPVPGRGYWARVHAGQTPYRPKLPSREPQWHDQGALTVAASEDVASVDVSSEDAANDMSDAAWLAERTAFEERPENRIEVPEVTRTWDSVIRAVRDELETAASEMRESKKAAERYKKRPDWRSPDADASWRWRSSEDRGQRLWDTHKSVAFRVSLGTYKRALAITNALAIAANAREFDVREDEVLGRLVFAGHNAEIQMRITEQLEVKYRPRIGYDGKKEQERYKVPTGRLRISLQVGYSEGPSFEDRENHQLESRLNHVFIAMYCLVVKRWKRDRASRAAELRAREAERISAEKERVRAERERKALQERRRRKRLSREARRWAEANRLRAYVAYVQSVSPRSDEQSSLSDWAIWALAVADVVDPVAKRLARGGRMTQSANAIKSLARG